MTAFISSACVEPAVCTPPNSISTPDTASKKPIAKNLRFGNAFLCDL